MATFWLVLILITQASSALWREVFSPRPISEPRYGTNLAPNTCAADTVRRSPWSFRHKSDQIVSVTNTTDGTDIQDGDWVRFSGYVNISCSTVCPPDRPPENITAPARSDSRCSTFVFTSGWSFSAGMYIGSFVTEYRWNTNVQCGKIYYGSTELVAGNFARTSPNFQAQDTGFGGQVVNFYNNALRPLLTDWPTNTGGTIALPDVTNLQQFCGLRIIQCLSIPSDYPFEVLDAMFPLLHPSIFSPDTTIGVDARAYDYSNITGYALLLGGDFLSSFKNPTNLNWNAATARNYAISLDAMFMLDLSFNPSMQLALNAPRNLRVLLLSGSPGIELQYAISSHSELGNRAGVVDPVPECNVSYCINPGKRALDFLGTGEGAHPPNLRVLSVTVDRSHYSAYYLRNFTNMRLFHVDDSDFDYPGAYESVYSLQSPAQVNDQWPTSTLSKYDVSCRDMYFDRYFFHGETLKTNPISLPGNWERSLVDPFPTPTPAAPDIPSTGKPRKFMVVCWLSKSNPMMHFSVFGLPIQFLYGKDGTTFCFGSSLQTLQAEGTMISKVDDLFSSTSANEIFSGNALLPTLRLSHNVRLSNIDSLLNIPMKNLYVYGNNHLSLAISNTQQPSKLDHIDASFSEVLKNGWENLMWRDVPKITCRACAADKWPTLKDLSAIKELRIPMNPALAFNMTEFDLLDKSINTQRAYTFFKTFSNASILTLLDISYNKIFGHFPNIPLLPFPPVVSFAWNLVEAYKYDNSYHYDDAIFPPSFDNWTLVKSNLNLRGNAITGKEPSWFPTSSPPPRITLTGNQISCPISIVNQSTQCTNLWKFKLPTSEYCSWPILNELPRSISTFETSTFDMKLNTSFLVSASTNFFKSCSISEAFGSTTCIGQFCAFLKFKDNTIFAKDIDPSFARNSDSILRFGILKVINVEDINALCSTSSQMPLIKNGVVVGCQVDIELWFGNNTFAQKSMVLPPVMLIAQCGEGRRYSEGNCLPCPSATYLPKPDSSWSVDTKCIPCPTNAVTQNEGAISIAECFCPNGTYGHPTRNECAGSGDCCVQCPANAHCFYPHNELPFPEDGYLLNPQNLNVMIECIPQTACKNNTCTPSYTGTACNKCATFHYRLQQECLLCPEADGLVVFLGVLIFFLMSLLLLKGSKPDISKIYTISITIGFVQIISIFASFPVSWPAAASAMFDIFSFVNFNIDLFSPECAMGLTFYQKWGLKMALPLILTAFFLLFFVAIKFVPLIRKYYIKFLLWKLGTQLLRLVPKKYQQMEGDDSQKAEKLNNNYGDMTNNTFETVDGGESVKDVGKEQVVVRSLNSLPLGASRRFTEAEISVSLGLERVVPMSAAAQYEIDRQWEDSHLSNRFVHAFVASCCLGYTFLTKTATQVFNCVDTGGGHFIRYDPSVACYNDEWYNMEIVAIFAVLVYAFGIPFFFGVILVRAWRNGSIETPDFYLHYGQLVLPYRAQYWYWELIQISRKLIIVLLIDFGASAQGSNTYTQISGVLIVLLLFLVLQEFIKPYEFTWCNRLAFSWTAISLLVLVGALFFVVGSLTESQRSLYGIGLLISCVLGLLISVYTAYREGKRATAKTKVAPTKDFLARGQEEQAVVNTIFGRSIGEPLYRKTRGLHPTARAGFYQRLVRLHTGLPAWDKQELTPEEELAQVRARLNHLESMRARASTTTRAPVSLELTRPRPPTMSRPSLASRPSSASTGIPPLLAPLTPTADALTPRGPEPPPLTPLNQ